MRRDIIRVLIETAVRKALREIKSSSKRSTRNLVDMAQMFATGRFQKKIFGAAQKMLRNDKSAYYGLAKEITRNANHDVITAFGINIGYNSCIKGAKTIRQTEERLGFNIPWQLSLCVDKGAFEHHKEEYRAVIEQGKTLGIYTYLILTRENAEQVLLLPEGNGDCAFVLFVEAEAVTPDFLRSASRLCNIMVAVSARGSAAQACEDLRSGGFLFALYYEYGDADVPDILNGKLISSMIALRPYFVIFISSVSCSDDTREKVCRYVQNSRNGQKQPTVLIDLLSDSLQIDRIISDDVCFAAFDLQGRLITLDGPLTDSGCNLFCNTLKDILMKAVSKKRHPEVKPKATTEIF